LVSKQQNDGIMQMQMQQFRLSLNLHILAGFLHMDTELQNLMRGSSLLLDDTGKDQPQLLDRSYATRLV
jgi:hypothetical protein